MEERGSDKVFSSSPTTALSVLFSCSYNHSEAHEAKRDENGHGHGAQCQEQEPRTLKTICQNTEGQPERLYLMDRHLSYRSEPTGSVFLRTTGSGPREGRSPSWPH